MAIATLDQYIAAVKQRIPFIKTATRTTTAGFDFNLFELAGNPGAGVLAGTSTTVGVVPTDATAGCPTINFSSGVGYITNAQVSNTAAGRMKMWDMLFKAGAYAFSAGTTNLSTQPVISQRCPDYPGSGIVFGAGLEIWIEVTTAFATGNNWQVQVTYTNSAGTAGRTSIILAAQNAASMTLGKMFQLALQSGDSGVQKIESVIVTNGATAMTAGNFNVLILRPLFSARANAINFQVNMNLLDLGAPIIYTDSALYLTVQMDSTSSSTPELVVEIASA